MAAQSLRMLDFSSKHENHPPAELDEGFCQPSRVSVSTGDVLPLLLDAALANRAWLEDFADDTMEIPQDLYEVLVAYRRYRSDAA